jgi:hypothetical protein
MYTLTVLDYVIEELVLDTRAGKNCLKLPQMSGVENLNSFLNLN